MFKTIEAPVIKRLTVKKAISQKNSVLQRQSL